MLAEQTQIMLARAQHVEFWLHPPCTNFGARSSWKLRFISKMGIELKWVSQGASVGVMDAEECLIEGFLRQQLRYRTEFQKFCFLCDALSMGFYS